MEGTDDCVGKWTKRRRSFGLLVAYWSTAPKQSNDKLDGSKFLFLYIQLSVVAVGRLCGVHYSCRAEI